MKKLKFNLQADMVMQIKAGEKEGIIDANGTIYLPVMAGFAGVGDEEIKEEKAETKPAKKEAPKAEVKEEVKPEPKKEKPAPKKEKPAPEPEVVDDTVTEEKPEEKAEEAEEADMFSGKEELSFEELDKGLPLWVYINAEGMNDKLWAAEVGRIEDDKIYVVFDEDGEEDFLRTGDRVFKKDLKF